METLFTILKRTRWALLASEEMKSLYIADLAFHHEYTQCGDCFIAIQGKQHHGMDFETLVSQNNPSLIVTEGEESEVLEKNEHEVYKLYLPQFQLYYGEFVSAFYKHPTHQMHCVGITGTNGKTSCSHFIGQALLELGHRMGQITTLGNGFMGHLIYTPHTTDDAHVVQQSLATFRDQGAECVVLEATSHALDQGRLSGSVLDTVMFTNLTHEHLDYHENMDAYGHIKASLFSDYDAHIGILNLDDSFSQKIRAISKCRYHIGVTLNEMDVCEGIDRIIKGVLNEDKTHLKVFDETCLMTLELPVPGEIYAYNYLLTIAYLLTRRVHVDQLEKVFQNMEPVPGRLNLFGGDKMPLVMVDYAHTPDAIGIVLKQARTLCEGKLFCVFGCGGDRDKGKRAMMGEITEQLTDRVILTDDNYRSEDPLSIIEDILSGMRCHWAVSIEHDREQALLLALSEAKEGDVILLAGKGHEQSVQEGKHMQSDLLMVTNMVAASSKSA